MVLVERYVVYNYLLLFVVVVSVEGVWIVDIDGLCYLDWLVVYLVVNFGYCNFVSIVMVYV